MKEFDDLDAIAFDAFGTLCRVMNPRLPFAILFERLGLASREAGHAAMTINMDIPELVKLFGKNKKIKFDDIQTLMAEELASVELYPDTLETLEDLKNKGYMLAVVSNLAKPYADPIVKLLADYVDEFIWSFELAAAKPERKVFATVCQRLECIPPRVLMVGDSWEADVIGGTSFGMPSLFIDREGNADPNLRKIHSLSELMELPRRRFYKD